MTEKSATLESMASVPRRTGGRPSCGYVQAFRLRLGLDSAQAVLAMTSELHKPYQPFLAALVDVALNHLDELPDLVPDDAQVQTLDGAFVAPTAAHGAGTEAFRDFKLRLGAVAAAAVNAATSDVGRAYQPYLAALVEVGLRHRDELPPRFCPQALLTTQEVLLGKTG